AVGHADASCNKPGAIRPLGTAASFRTETWSAGAFETIRTSARTLVPKNRKRREGAWEKPGKEEIAQHKPG
ncbi:TPA: hypothetical protein DDW35_07910, partial [Candidatus Sumerlaeota bacterium]|nr:hypothetical protein [Candidatus Sumerlaeota bacterium]